MRNETPTAFDLARGLLARTLTCADVAHELAYASDDLEGPAALVHALRHFVADQDIRARDKGYETWQEGELRQMLEASEGPRRDLGSR